MVVNRLTGLYTTFAGRYAATLSTPSSLRTVLIIALIAIGIIVACLVVAIAFLPKKRKVIRRRRVRRTRRLVAQPLAAGTAVAVSSKPAVSPATARSRRRLRTALWATAWVVIVALAFVAVYTVSGSNQYCGESCHATDPHVALAVKNHHAECVDCHESDPVSGIISRVRMALVRTPPDASVAETPVDPDRCLRCHGTVASNTVTTKAGLVVSHKEIIAGGRACSDCHSDVGHVSSTVAVAGGMSECTSCHDGKVAKRTCETCHVGGSPIAVASAAKKIRSSFDYGPAMRVANRDCARCHGPETECRACHNGLVLPHPAAFVQGGHARMAAFTGKQKCFKCHSLAWCGNDACHHSFSAHSETAWAKGHQQGTSEQCGSCHMSWKAPGDFCKVCH